MMFRLTAAFLAALALAGCANLRSSEPEVSYLSMREAGSAVAKLVQKLHTADQGTLALKADKEDDAMSADLTHRACEALKTSGFAVQEILPDDRLQKGDKGYSGSSLPRILIRIDKLDDSNMYQLRVISGTDAFYRMLSQKGTALAPASGWSRQQNY